jgi:DNA-binding response OmpR family regulator
MSIMAHSGTTAEPTGAKAQSFTVLLYSDRAEVRDRIRQAIGARPAADMSVKFVDASSYDGCIALVDRTDIDLLVLDGEAQPAGGLGIARQLRDEVDECPPICVVIARTADRWLAAYAKVDATLVHPLDPMTTGRTVAEILRAHPPRTSARPLTHR